MLASLQLGHADKDATVAVFRHSRFKLQNVIAILLLRRQPGITRLRLQHPISNSPLIRLRILLSADLPAGQRFAVEQRRETVLRRSIDCAASAKQETTK